ncbi:hypothetical protein BH09BAC3_BH09BAC3_38080 [soil metagenome]
MAKLRKATKADLSAMFSDDVVVRKYRNQNLVSNVKRPKASKSIKRKAANDGLIEANIWAKAILLKPEVKELYSKKISARFPSAHTVAVSDYLEAPKVHYINLKSHTGAVGDKIRIKATDNFGVVSVDVIISDANGVELEKGKAVRYARKPVMWIYMLTKANPVLAGTVIQAIAWDRPGHKGEMEVKVGE